MKRTITFSLLSAIALWMAWVNPLTAQNTNTDMSALAKKYESAYNQKDIKVIKGMYTKDAVRVNTDGSRTTGSEAIAELVNADFKNNKTIVKIKVDKNVKESDGSITSTGTYHVTGATGSGEKIDFKGAFTNTTVKEGGKWKIAKSVLSSQ